MKYKKQKLTFIDGPVEQIDNAGIQKINSTNKDSFCWLVDNMNIPLTIWIKSINPRLETLREEKQTA